MYAGSHSTAAPSEAVQAGQASRRIAIFGSTGSIGTQALEVVSDHPDLFRVAILTAHANADLLIKQAVRFRPHTVVIVDERGYPAVREALSPLGIAVMAGVDALEEAAAHPDYDMMLAAIVGFAGLRPTLRAIDARKPVALANKETLVVAGDIVMQRAVEGRVPVIPVDSEHSAIFQCLVGETHNRIEKIILTASGGPFVGRKPNFLVNVRKEHALQHPNWSMGAKITIDSATLMNKGLEMIEARWLFNLEPSRIQVVVHPQSIIHSMVQFEDGSIKAQMGLPDMKLPIQYALAYPRRIPNTFPRFDFTRSATLAFEPPDVRTFRNLALATDAMFRGGNAPAVLNAANEIAVFGFLRNRIGFLEMTDMIEKTLAHVPFLSSPTLDDYFESDGEARNFAASLMNL